MRCCCRGGTVDTLLNVLQLFWTRKREKKGIASFSTHSTRWQDHLAAVHLTPNMRKKPPHHTLISSVLVSFVFGVNGGTSQVQCPVPYNNKARKHHLKIVRWINAIRNAHGTYLVSFKEPCTHTHAHTIFSLLLHTTACQLIIMIEKLQTGFLVECAILYVIPTVGWWIKSGMKLCTKKLCFWSVGFKQLSNSSWLQSSHFFQRARSLL